MSSLTLQIRYCNKSGPTVWLYVCTYILQPGEEEASFVPAKINCGHCNNLAAGLASNKYHAVLAWQRWGTNVSRTVCIVESTLGAFNNKVYRPYVKWSSQPQRNSGRYISNMLCAHLILITRSMTMACTDCHGKTDGSDKQLAKLLDNDKSWMIT